MVQMFGRRPWHLLRRRLRRHIRFQVSAEGYAKQAWLQCQDARLCAAAAGIAAAAAIATTDALCDMPAVRTALGRQVPQTMLKTYSVNTLAVH